MHCHLIVSRNDQTNKKNLSPLTNHKNTQKGTVAGGFDRVNLFKQAEQAFDKLFNYDRQQSEAFNYYNTMKNSSLFEQFNLQVQEVLIAKKRITNNQDNLVSFDIDNNESVTKCTARCNQSNNQESYPSPSFIVASDSTRENIVCDSSKLEKKKKRKIK